MKISVNNNGQIVDIKDNTFVANAAGNVGAGNVFLFYFVDSNGDVYRNTEISYGEIAVKRSDGMNIGHLLAIPFESDEGWCWKYTITETDGVLYAAGQLSVSAHFVKTTLTEGVITKRETIATVSVTAHVQNNIGLADEDTFNTTLENAMLDRNTLQAEITQNVNDIADLETDKLEVSTYNANRQTDNSTRDAQDNALGARIDAETSARQQADNTLTAAVATANATANAANATANAADGKADSAVADATEANSFATNALAQANAAVSTANNAKSIAEGREKAGTYSTVALAVSGLNAAADTDYKVGDNVYIVTTDVPDLWIAGVAETSVPYEYTTDEAFTEAFADNGTLQIGYYTCARLESGATVKPTYIEAFARTGATELASDWLSLTGADGTALTPKVGEQYCVLNGDNADELYRWNAVAYVPLSTQIQSDWGQTDNTAVDFIKNKPTIPEAQTNLPQKSVAPQNVTIPTTGWTPVYGYCWEGNERAEKNNTVEIPCAIGDAWQTTTGWYIYAGKAGLGYEVDSLDYSSTEADYTQYYFSPRSGYCSGTVKIYSDKFLVTYLSGTSYYFPFEIRGLGNDTMVLGYTLAFSNASVKSNAANILRANKTNYELIGSQGITVDTFADGSITFKADTIPETAVNLSLVVEELSNGGYVEIQPNYALAIPSNLPVTSAKTDNLAIPTTGWQGGAPWIVGQSWQNAITGGDAFANSIIRTERIGLVVGETYALLVNANGDEITVEDAMGGSGAADIGGGAVGYMCQHYISDTDCISITIIDGGYLNTTDGQLVVDASKSCICPTVLSANYTPMTIASFTGTGLSSALTNTLSNASIKANARNSLILNKTNYNLLASQGISIDSVADGSIVFKADTVPETAVSIKSLNVQEQSGTGFAEFVLAEEARVISSAGKAKQITLSIPVASFAADHSYTHTLPSDLSGKWYVGSAIHIAAERGLELIAISQNSTTELVILMNNAPTQGVTLLISFTEAETPISGYIYYDTIYNQSDFKTREQITLATTDWTADSTIEPFAFKASKTLTQVTGLNDNCTLSLSIDAVTQAKYGIVIGTVVGQVVTLYAVTAPTASVTATIMMEG